jgi:hypothetical protein
MLLKIQESLHLPVSTVSIIVDEMKTIVHQSMEYTKEKSFKSPFTCTDTRYSGLTWYILKFLWFLAICDVIDEYTLYVLLQFSCGHIKDSFNSVNSYIKHISLIHRGDPNFNIACGIEGCYSTFRRFSSFTSHISRKHESFCRVQQNTEW